MNVATHCTTPHTTLPSGLLQWLRNTDFSTRREYLLRVTSHLYCTGASKRCQCECKLCAFVTALEVHYVCE